MLLLLDESGVTYADFDCAGTSYPEASTKSNVSTGNGKRFPDQVKTPCASQVTIDKTFSDKKHTSNVFLNPYKLWDMESAARLSLNLTLDRNLMIFHYPQASSQQPKTEN